MLLLPKVQLGEGVHCPPPITEKDLLIILGGVCEDGWMGKICMGDFERPPFTNSAFFLFLYTVVVVF